MTEEDRKPFAEMIVAVYDLKQKTPSQSALSIWWSALERFDLVAIRGAISRAVTNPDSGQFLITPADVIRELGGTSADASMLAFAKVVDAVRRIGTYHSVTFDDPITNRVLADLGGWTWFGNQTEKEMPFVEKRFRDAYRAWRARGLDSASKVTHLPGIFETANVANGYLEGIAPPKLIGDSRVAALIAKGEGK